MKQKSYLKKIISENFPNLGKEMDMQVQEAQSLKQNEPKEIYPRHIIIKNGKR